METAAAKTADTPGAIRRLAVRYERPHLYPAQERAIFEAPDINGAPARFAFIEASTKAGKTHGCIAWLFEQAALHGRPGRNFWWVAPVYPQAKIAFRRARRGLPKWSFTANESDLFIRLRNGATIWFKSGEKPDNLYGDDVYAAVIDEASRLREEAWHAIRSTLTATRGPCRMIGNVKGRKNWFFRMARKAQAGEPGLSFSKLTAYDAVAGGVLAAEEIESAKRDLPEAVFRELYLAEASEDGGNPFGLQHIEACVRPLSEDAPVAAGVDLAKRQDWTVVIALDRAGATCGFERWQSSWAVTEQRILDYTMGVPTLVDATGVGDPIYERISAKHRDAEPYVFSQKTKQALMEGLAWAIQSRVVTFPDGAIRAELENFEYVYDRTGVKYSAPAGYHDDCVVALALAVEEYRRVRPEIGPLDPGGITRISPWLDGGVEDYGVE